MNIDTIVLDDIQWRGKDNIHVNVHSSRFVRSGSLSLSDIVDTLVENMRNSIRIATISTYSYVLDEMSFNYSEKFILQVGLHYYFYYLGVKPRLYTPRGLSSIRVGQRNIPILSEKYFSGDVSGVISETLFAYIAINRLKVPMNCLVHLRPCSNEGFLTPDFVVAGRDNVLKVMRLMHYHGMRSAPSDIGSYMFVECKGCVSGTISSKRVEKGLKQLLKVMYKKRPSCGLLFITHRPRALGFVIHTVGLIYSWKHYDLEV